MLRKVSTVQLDQSVHFFLVIQSFEFLLVDSYTSSFLSLSLSLRTKGGDSKRLLENDLGAEHGNHRHGDQSEGEERGREQRRAKMEGVDVALDLTVCG